MMFAYYDTNHQVAMISTDKIEQTTFDEFQFPSTDPVYVQYKSTGGNLYIRNNMLKLE